MNFLTALFLIISVSAFGAVPAYTSFRGTGGILITSNPPLGNITIDGSGIFTSSGTNATIAISTNGVLVMVAATNVNFVNGTNMLLTVTNIGSTAHVGLHTVALVPIIEGAVTNLLLTWVLPILVVDNLTVTNLGSALPWSSVQFNSNGVTRGSPNFVFTNNFVGILAPQPTNRLDVNGHTSLRSNLFLANLPTNGAPIAFLAVDAAGAVYETALTTGVGSPTPAPPLNSVQFNSNGVQQGSSGFLYTNGVATVGEGVEITTGSLILNGGATALVAWNGLGHFRWDADGVVRLNNDSALDFNRINLGGTTAAFPAIGRTNGDVIILGANGNFKLGGSTNRLIAPAIHIANDGGVGTPLLSLDNPLSGIRWDVAIDSNPQTYFLGLGRVGDATPTMVWEIGGNVGIGTTNPATTLDVNGRTFLRSNVWMSAIPSNATPVAFLSTDSGGEVYETAIPTVAASAETNAVLTNIIGTVAGNVTNVVSLSTTNATSKPLTNAYANGVLTLFGLEAGANVTITPNASNLVIAATGGGTPGGNSGAIQFNEGGAFAGTNHLIWDRTNRVIRLDGHLLFPTDNTYDIGASGATRPRNLYVGTDIRAGADIHVGNAWSLVMGARGYVTAPADGVFELLNAAATSFNRLQLGGTSAAFPAIGRTNGDLIVFGANGAFGAVATNRLHVPGGIVLTNANVAAGKVWTAVGDLGGGTWSNAPAAGGGAVAWASNSIPFMNPAGNALVFYNPGNSLSNGGFGFHPIGPHGGGAYGGLRVFSDYSSGLLTIGHPNPGSAFATFVTALSVSNAYAGTGFKQEMSKYDATDVSEGSDPSSTFVTYRTWSGGTPTIAAEVRKDGMGFFSHGTMYQSNSLASTMPTAAELGPGGYWAGVSNTSFVVVYSANGTTTSMKVLSP